MFGSDNNFKTRHGNYNNYSILYINDKYSSVYLNVIKLTSSNSEKVVCNSYDVESSIAISSSNPDWPTRVSIEVGCLP